MARFMARFEAGAVTRAEWTHEAHLVVGFWLVSRLGPKKALERLRPLLRRHNESIGIANTATSGYHETITRLYLQAIGDHITAYPHHSSESCLALLLRSPLAERDWPLQLYPRQRLFSPEARRSWVEPASTMRGCGGAFPAGVSEARALPRAELVSIAEAFALTAPVVSVEPLGSGNVNDTYLVRLAGQERPAIVLQRLNTHVFRQPRQVIHNMLVVSRHVRRRLAEGVPALAGRRWEVPAPLPDRAGERHWVEEPSGFWRAIDFIDSARSIDVVEDHGQAVELGRGLGTFHALISDLPSDDLADTLEGFHITPGYLQRLHTALAGLSRPLTGQEEWCVGFVAERQSFVAVLEEARARGELQSRPIHGDPKVNNLLLDRGSGEAVALIDLDTVKPGLVHYDIGDALRSACNPLGEETTDWGEVRFDPERCGAILQGYLGVARSFLSGSDYRYLYDAIRLLALELGIRFLTDHLEGNPYFRASRPRHNLERALVQFHLTRSIEAQEGPLRVLIAGLR
jgi:Ser/Thr protein kinase RdoA (MazF antagonist)